MTSPQLVSGLPEPAAPSISDRPPQFPANPEPHLNPLFQPDTLAHLANSLLAELQRNSLSPELASGRAPALVASPAGVQAHPTPGYLPEIQPAAHAAEQFEPGVLAVHPVDGRQRPALPGSAGVGAGPCFYFVEELTYPTQVPNQYFPSPPAVPNLAAPTGVIDPLGVPQVVNQAGQRQGAFEVEAVRRDFPILREQVNGKPLIWLDNAATTQKPQVVIDRLANFYAHENSNIHRAAHELAARATDAYEGARETVRRFLNASSSNEIVFVRGTTEGINLVAKSWGAQTLQAGDEIVISHLEHHANIVPWQQLAAQTGARLRVAPVDDRGQILLNEYQQLLNARTKLVAFSQVSNALGTVTPAKTLVELAQRVGAKVLVDGAQSVSHLAVDVQQLGCDWFVFSGHKVFGPTGIGVVYGREELWNATAPWQGGGNMIVDVTFERTVYHDAPARFEAGTGNIADAVGLATALDYVQAIGLETIARYEHELLEYATAGLRTIPGLRLIGTAAEKASVLSFVLDGFAVETVGQALNEEGIAVRAGHHCAQPILRRFGVEGTVRPSLAFYNTRGEVEALVGALERLRQRELG